MARNRSAMIPCAPAMTAPGKPEAMPRAVPVYDTDAVRAALPMAALVDACAEAFAAYSSGGAALPSVIHLDIAEQQAEVHVKAGYVRGARWWALKVASGFPGNPARGLPANDGLVVV